MTYRKTTVAFFSTRGFSYKCHYLARIPVGGFWFNFSVFLFFTLDVVLLPLALWEVVFFERFSSRAIYEPRFFEHRAYSPEGGRFWTPGGGSGGSASVAGRIIFSTPLNYNARFRPPMPPEPTGRKGFPGMTFRKPGL